MTSLFRRLFRGTILNFIAMAFNQGSTLVVNVVVARVLKLSEFGEYSMVCNTLLTISTLAQLASGYTASKYVAEYRFVAPQRAEKILGLCSIVAFAAAIIVSTMLFFSSTWFARNLLNAEHLSSALVVGTFFLFFTTLNGFQTGALSGLEGFRELAYAGILSGILSLIFIPCGALLGGVSGTIAGLSAAAVARCAFHRYWLNSKIQLSGLILNYSNAFEEKEVFFKFALPSAISGYFSMPIIWLGNYLLVSTAFGYNEMAIYASAMSIKMIVMFIPHVINNVALPLLNNSKGAGNRKAYFSVFKSSARATFFIMLILVICLSVFGDKLLSVFGKSFESGEFVLQFMLISTFFEGLSICLFQHIQAEGKIWEALFQINIPRETAFIILAWMLVDTYGALGLSIAYSFSWLFALLIISYKVFISMKIQSFELVSQD